MQALTNEKLRVTTMTNARLHAPLFVGPTSTRGFTSEWPAAHGSVEFLSQIGINSEFKGIGRRMLGSTCARLLPCKSCKT